MKKIILEDKKVIKVGNSLAITIDDKKAKKHFIEEGEVFPKVTITMEDHEP